MTIAAMTAIKRMTFEKIEALSYYARKLERLRVDRAHGVAPHKPILLLAVMELFERQVIHENRLDLSPRLNQVFLKYWSYLGSAHHNPDISRPFFHMKSGKFWHLVANPGFETILAAKIKLKTLAEVKQAISHAYLDEDLFDFLQEPSIRESLLAVLVGRWFPGQLMQIKEISKTDDFQEPSEAFLQSCAMYRGRQDQA